jgi:hypothetical protein
MVAWAVGKGLLEDPKLNPRKELVRRARRAVREVRIKDEQGRTVREMLPAKIPVGVDDNGNMLFQVMYDHIHKMTADHALLSFDQRAELREKNPNVRLDLEDANLSSAVLSNADLRNADLRNADLSSADLSGAKLIHADLGEANLSEAELSFADLRKAYLLDANLFGASLFGANLVLAYLRGADLSNADLKFTAFSRAKLAETKFDGAMLHSTFFSNVDLSEAKGLKSVKHTGPSTIGTDTLVNLKGTISADLREFLRGCGLEPWEVEMARLYDPAMTSEEIADHMTTKVFAERTRGDRFVGGVFISYAHENLELVDKLHAGLKEQDITTWLDRHDFVAGSITGQIARAIRINDQVALVLSKASIKSDWVWDEIETTLEKEKEQGSEVLFPIRVDDEWEAAAPEGYRHLIRKIKKKLILDFSTDEAFEENLPKLINGMKMK